MKDLCNSKFPGRQSPRLSGSPSLNGLWQSPRDGPSDFGEKGVVPWEDVLGTRKEWLQERPDTAPHPVGTGESSSVVCSIYRQIQFGVTCVSGSEMKI